MRRRLHVFIDLIEFTSHLLLYAKYRSLASDHALVISYHQSRRLAPDRYFNGSLLS